jgi:transglutaminase-like putative cysteine protease
MPYDYQKINPYPNLGKSVLITEPFDRKLAVCRHHALYTQVLLQSFGITSRLLKCNLGVGQEKGEPHACNLVRVNGKWSILDATNPEVNKGVGEVFLTPIPGTDIDTNKYNYTWQVQCKKGQDIRTYQSRHNMFYKYTGNNKP